MQTSLDAARQGRSHDVVLIDTSPLLQLALRRILIDIPGIGRVDCVLPAELGTFRAHGSIVVHTDLLVLGMGSDGDGGLGLLSDACRIIRPRAMLLLADGTQPHGVASILGDVPFAWLPKSASLAALDTAVHRLLPEKPAPARAAGPGGRPGPALPEPGRPRDRDEAQQLGLTHRQYEILVQLSLGYPFKAIAKNLHLSVSTIKTHAQTVYKRLGASSRSGAVYAARQLGASLRRQEEDPEPAQAGPCHSRTNPAGAGRLAGRTASLGVPT